MPRQLLGPSLELEVAEQCRAEPDGDCRGCGKVEAAQGVGAAWLVHLGTTVPSNKPPVPWLVLAVPQLSPGSLKQVP